MTVSGSGISWAICKSAPRSRQITTPASHYSGFLQAGCPSCRPTNSVKALKACRKHATGCKFSQITKCRRTSQQIAQSHQNFTGSQQFTLHTLRPRRPGAAVSRRSARRPASPGAEEESCWCAWLPTRTVQCPVRSSPALFLRSTPAVPAATASSAARTSTPGHFWSRLTSYRPEVLFPVHTVLSLPECDRSCPSVSFHCSSQIN